MASVFSQAFNTAYHAKTQERQMQQKIQVEREDPITALKLDHAVNQLGMDAVDLRAAQLKERITTDQINEKARGLTMIEEALNKNGNNVEAFSTLAPNGNKVFDGWLEQVQAQGAKLAVRNKVTTLFNNAAKFANEAEAVALSGIDTETPEGRADLILLSGKINERRAAEAKAKQEQDQANRLALQQAKQRDAALSPLGKLIQEEQNAIDSGDAFAADIYRKEREMRFNKTEESLRASLDRLRAQGLNTSIQNRIESALARERKAIADMNNPRVVLDAAQKGALAREAMAARKQSEELQAELEKVFEQKPVPSQPSTNTPAASGDYQPFGNTGLRFKVVP